MAWNIRFDPNLVVGGAPSEYNGLTPNYYISTFGSDSNNGLTPATAWAITAINTKRATYAGGIVGILDGTYSLITIMGQPSAAGHSADWWLGVGGGSSGSPTIVVSQTPRGAILDFQRASLTADSGNGTMGPAGNYVTIDGLTFTGNNYQCVVNNSSGNGGYDYLTVKNCLFTDQSFDHVWSLGQNSNMFYTQGGDHILVSNCYFDGGNAVNDQNRHNNIMGYTPTTDFVIEYCTFVSEALGADVIHWKQQGVTNGVIRNCYVDRSAVTQTQQGPAIIKYEGVNSGSDTTEIYNNVFKSGGTTARRIFSAQPNTAGTYNFYDNTFIGPWTNDGCILLFDTRAPTQINSYRNIFHRVSGTGGTYGDFNVYSTGVMGTVDYNYYSTSVKLTVGDHTDYTSLASWQSATSKDANSTTGSDPSFAASGDLADYYKLQGGSPCKTLGPGSTEIGAWRSATQIGCDWSP